MSKKNQTFRNLPDINIINCLLETFGLESLDDNRLFTKEHMVEIDTVNNLPCKCKNYLENITEKKSITILRQFIKIHNYKIITFEKSIKGKKHMIYQMTPISDDFLSPNKNSLEEKRKYIISFDM